MAASWGRVLCCSFADLTGEVYTFRGDTKYSGREVTDDSVLVAAISDELATADIIVSWNGILFDVPFLNARLQKHGLAPFQAKTWPNGSHLDLMYYATGAAMKTGSKKLDNIAKFFNLPNQKTPLNGETWQRAAAGDKSAMDLVVEHCEADVMVLRDTLPILAPHVKKLVLPFNKWWEYADKITL